MPHLGFFEKCYRTSEYVFLVDVGAVELREKYPEATNMVDDVYYRYNKYIGGQ